MSFLAAAILGFGIAVAGLFIGCGLEEIAKALERR